MAALRASLAVGSTIGCAFTRQRPSAAACRQDRNVGTAASTTSAAAATRRQSLLASAAVAAGLLSGSRSVAAAATSGGGDEAAAVLEDPQWPAEMPYRPEMFQRYDESSDTVFYEGPRFVTHIDDGAIKALTAYYAEHLPPCGDQRPEDTAVLDICSSWISHYPGRLASRVAGLGMNAEELKRNPQLTEWAVQDLNVDPRLPYESDSFDAITNVVSVDYLTKPLEVFAEMHRCLKPGGIAIMSFSNRCFPTKAISMWTSTGDLDHVWIVGSYFHYSVPGGFTKPQAKDISPACRGGILGGGGGGGGDPMYVVYARKQPAAAAGAA